jgi:hypothetical protein
MNKNCHPKCLAGQHPFVRIYTIGAEEHLNVVRWCPECGAIVIDVDKNGITNHGEVMKLRIPTISK